MNPFPSLEKGFCFVFGDIAIQGFMRISWEGIIKMVPLSHSAALFRRIIMAEPLATAFNGVVGDYRSGLNWEWAFILKSVTSLFRLYSKS